MFYSWKRDIFATLLLGTLHLCACAEQPDTKTTFSQLLPVTTPDNRPGADLAIRQDEPTHTAIENQLLGEWSAQGNCQLSFRRNGVVSASQTCNLELEGAQGWRLQTLSQERPWTVIVIVDDAQTILWRGQLNSANSITGYLPNVGRYDMQRIPSSLSEG